VTKLRRYTPISHHLNKKDVSFPFHNVINYVTVAGFPESRLNLAIQKFDFSILHSFPKVQYSGVISFGKLSHAPRIYVTISPMRQ
jgi:hypothetical protein